MDEENKKQEELKKEAEEKIEEGLQEEQIEKQEANNNIEKEVANEEKKRTEEKLADVRKKQKESKEEKTNTEKKQKTTEPDTAVIKEKQIGEEEGNKEKEKKENQKRLIIVITFAVAIFAILLFSVIFSLLNINNNKILNGIFIMGIDVSNLTTDEATQKLNEIATEKLDDDIVLKHGEAETLVDGNTFNAKFDVDTAVIEAYNIGRDGNIITNNYGILFTKIWGRNVDCKLYLDKELLQNTINDIESKMTDAVIQSSYYIEEKNLIIVSGKSGYSIKQQELKDDIYEIIQDTLKINAYQEIEIPVEQKNPDAIDIEKIRNEIYKEPQNAYVEKEPVKVHPHVDGVDFAISIGEAKELIKEEKEEYTIPLTITPPEKTIADLGEEAFPEMLATFSTRYDASNKNRSTNIELATQKINGTIIMPGENFSYNTVVGKRTIEAGFKEGTAYIGGKVVPDVGGGVCQVSSTLYNTALLANLEIKERSNHMFLTSYVPASRDATVYTGSIDLVFKNTRSYPIKIAATSQNGVCKISFYGIKEETEYEVIIQSKITSYINYTTVYKDDNTLEKGKEVVEQTGSNGCKSEAYRILKLNGKVVSQTLLSKDTYSPMQRIVRRGTK